MHNTCNMHKTITNHVHYQIFILQSKEEIKIATKKKYIIEENDCHLMIYMCVDCNFHVKKHVMVSYLQQQKKRINQNNNKIKRSGQCF